MFEELVERQKKLTERLQKLETIFDLPGKRQEIAILEGKISQPGFWNDQAGARAVTAQLSRIKDAAGAWEKITRGAADVGFFLELLKGEGETDSSTAELAADLDRIEAECSGLELRSMLSDPRDRCGVIMLIHAGAGGTEACVWVGMLLRMYRRWAETRGYTAEVLDMAPGEEAGFRSVTVGVKGEYAYGYLKCEQGVHRLVRISPFDAAKRRHTSFASVDVVPEVEDAGEIEIKDEDIRIDTFRAHGAGGQHVNKTDSAVRMTHVPTGIVVQCQNERSQYKNRVTAMRVLTARVAEHCRRIREEEIAKQRGEKQDIAWGSQIRSYVFQPYQMVKDHRTKHESGNVQAVMDGEIQPFIEAFLSAPGKAAGPDDDEEPA
ncbi:MAG: peptide chain release factor 2 [Candidatus Aureabacteria bacterium]|nr:peptide chain release factor 2 [Candidatus Auribacterota bacterium]